MKKIPYLIIIIQIVFASCEKQTNTSPGIKFTDDISVAENSRFAIAWNEANHSYARSYDATGSPVTGQINVSQNLQGDNQRPSIGIANSGMFVVAYGNYIYNQNNSWLSYRIYCQQFSAVGTAVGPAKFIDFGTMPQLSMTANGDFIISYQYYGISGVCNVYAQRFDANANPIGSRILVDAITGNFLPNNQTVGSDINMKCDGEFIVAYGNVKDVSYIKRFNATVFQKGSRILINTSNFNPTRISEKCLTYNANGFFNVTYGRPNPSIQNQEDYYVNRYDLNGNLTSTMLLWTNAVGSNPPISGNPCGDYALIFKDKVSDNIMVRCYSYADIQYPDIQVNQSKPIFHVPLIGLSSNSFVAVWDRKTGSTTINSFHNKLPIPSASNNTLAGQSKSVCLYGCTNGCQKTAIIGSPPVPGYTYSWTPTTHLNNSNVAQPTVTHPGGVNTFSITYTLTVKPANNSSCCQRTEQVVVTFDKGCL